MDGQNRKKNVVRNYNHPDGKIEAIVDICHEHKTDYAIPIAIKIGEHEDEANFLKIVVDYLLEPS